MPRSAGERTPSAELRRRDLRGVRLAVGVLLLAGACDRAPSAGPSPRDPGSKVASPVASSHASRSPEAVASPPEQAAPPEARASHAAAPRGPRVARVRGSVRAGANMGATAELAQGAVFIADSIAVLADGAFLVLDFEDGGRLEATGPAQLALSGVAPAAVRLGFGCARALLPPAGDSARPPLAIAGAQAIVEIQGAGDVVVCVGNDRLDAMQLAGMARLSRGARDPDGRVVEQVLTAGQAAHVTDAVPVRAVRGPQTLDQALAMGRRPEGRFATRGAISLGELDAAIDALDAERTHARELAQRHRQALAVSNVAAADVQREIVLGAQRAFRIRDAAWIAWERAAAAALQNPRFARDLVPRGQRVESLLGRGSSS